MKQWMFLCIRPAWGEQRWVQLLSWAPTSGRSGCRMPSLHGEPQPSHPTCHPCRSVILSPYFKRFCAGEVMQSKKRIWIRANAISIYLREQMCTQINLCLISGPKDVQYFKVSDRQTYCQVVFQEHFANSNIHQ